MSDLEQAFRKVVASAHALREDLVATEEWGDPIQVDFSGKELAGLVYALGFTYMAEAALPDANSRKIMDLISEASTAILTASAAEGLDLAINDILGGGDGT